MGKVIEIGKEKLGRRVKILPHIDNSEAVCSQETFFKLGRIFTSDKDTEAERTR